MNQSSKPSANVSSAEKPSQPCISPEEKIRQKMALICHERNSKTVMSVYMMFAPEHRSNIVNEIKADGFGDETDAKWLSAKMIDMLNGQDKGTFWTNFINQADRPIKTVTDVLRLLQKYGLLCYVTKISDVIAQAPKKRKFGRR